MNVAGAAFALAVLGFAWALVFGIALNETTAAIAAGLVGSVGVVSMFLFADEADDADADDEDLTEWEEGA